MTANQAINTNRDFESSRDLNGRLETILIEINEKLKFQPEKILWKSDYFGSGKLGAINYLGKFNGQKAVLKIQGAKPEISEVWMINQFTKQNRSQIIRAPKIYNHIPWNDEKKYEIIIMESVEGNKLIEEGKPVSEAEVKIFFEAYREYKEKCISESWLECPKNLDNGRKMLEKGWEMSKKIKPYSPFRIERDWETLLKASEILDKVYKTTPLQFMHGHLSVNDLKRQNDEIVIFSNLFWKWKYPYYDAVFAYHWFIYSLERDKQADKKLIDNQRKIWKKVIYKITKDTKLITAALLERAMAGLVLDGLVYIDEKNALASYMVESTREEVIKLTEELSSM